LTIIDAISIKFKQTKFMKYILKAEFLALLIFFGYLLFQNPLMSWWIVLLFWLPDAGFLAYLIHPKLGLVGYNFTHFIGTGLVLLVLGYFLKIEWLIFAGLIDLTHIHFDRFFGYGLKYSDSFNHTHLGWIGKDKSKNTSLI
jgi:hypothetical protein